MEEEEESRECDDRATIVCACLLFRCPVFGSRFRGSARLKKKRKRKRKGREEKKKKKKKRRKEIVSRGEGEGEGGGEGERDNRSTSHTHPGEKQEGIHARGEPRCPRGEKNISSLTRV